MTTIASLPPGVDRPAPSNPAGRQALKDLGASLKSGDLDGARQAYLQVIKNAPEGATWNPDSGFAQVGRALLAGDVEAAREAARSALQDRRPDAIKAPVMPAPAPAPSTTGGSAGTLLNVVA